MALKNTLLAASIGATMIAGENTEAKETVAPVMTSYQAQSLSPAEIQEMNFQRNYRHLYNHVSGAYFSFGDERELRDSLYKIGSFPMGREVIAGIPPNMGFASTNFMPDATCQDAKGTIQEDIYAGLYNWRDNKLTINTEILDSDSLYYSCRADFLFHELLHAYQRHNGIMMLDNPSIEQSLISQKVIEAEAAAWNDVLQATQRITDDFSLRMLPAEGPYHLTSQQVRDLMRRDLVAEERTLCHETGVRFNATEFKKTDPVYRFQQALIACRGDYSAAQRKMVGDRIRERMQEQDTPWATAYNAQAIRSPWELCRLGRVSKNGNGAAYNRMLRYYQDQYGVSPRDITRMNFNSRQQEAIDIIRSDMDKYNAYSDTQVRPATQPSVRRDGGR